MQYRHIYITLVFILAIVLPIASLAQKDDLLPKTVVFKVAEQHRNVCEVDQINHAVFQQLMQDINVDRLEKIFPNKEKEDRVGMIDLSLIYQLQYKGNFTVNEIIRKIKKLKIAEYVEPYYLPQLCYTPSDTLLGNQWYINIINAPNGWNTNTGDTNIVIGITDTGWDTTHLDLQGAVKKNYNDPINGIDDDADGYIDNFMGWDLGNNDNNAHWESTAHGVNVSGIAAASTDNVTGVSGVGFNTSFLPVKISNTAGILTHAYQGIVYAADHGCDIINCSWGSYSASQFNQNVIDYATINQGCLVIAAVGNDNGEDVFYPAGYKGVLSVAATEQSDLKKNNSNYAYYVDVCAPGEFMWTTAGNNAYGTNGGTSMAAPVVAGCAAIFKAQFPSYTNQQIGALLQATTDNIYPLNPAYLDKLGTGRVSLENGVTAVNPQFIELTEHNVTDNNNNTFEFGDTLFIEGVFTNYLDPLSGLSVTISSTSPYVNVIDGTTLLPSMTTMATFNNTADRFTVEVLNGAPFNEVITFQAVITNGSYTNNEYFNVIINPDYINLEENLVATTITSTGKIGFNDINNTIGLGFTYNAEQLLYEAGLMIGDSPIRVADVVRGASGPDQDFATIQNVQYNPPYVSAKDLYGEMDDSPLVSSMDIEIRQSSYAFPTSPNDKFVIIEYEIENTGSATLNNLHVGIFADWDLDNANLNKAGYDMQNDLGYVHSMGNDTIYAAIQLLTETAINYSLDLDGSGGVDANGGGFTTNEKYTTLSTSRNSAGGSFGKDVAHVVSSTGFSLFPGAVRSMAFAILAGDSLLDIQNSATTAKTLYHAIVGVDEIEADEKMHIYPNPTKGLINIAADQKIEQVTVRNVLGEIILVSDQSQVNIDNQSNGMYFVEVKTASAILTEKVFLSK